MSAGFSTNLIPPERSEGSSQDFTLDSTLQELRLYTFQVDVACPTADVLRLFEQHPLVPGVILTHQDQYLGMLSRHRILEYLTLPKGMKLFLDQPLEVLYSYARTEVLILPANLPILAAAQQMLRRSPERLGDPLVVQLDSQTFRLLDVHELNVVSWQIRGVETQVRYERMQLQMIQSDKMANLGRLVDGVAHEVLDPVSFIWGNLTYVTTYTQDLLKLLATFEVEHPDPSPELTDLMEEIELVYIRQDLPRAIDSIKTGAERLTKLAASLQNFCHIDEVYPKPADLHEAIDGILLLLKGRLSSEVDVIKNYGQLPPVLCFIGQLSQVFMNIMINAVGSLLDHSVRQRIIAELHDTATLLPSENPDFKPRLEITTRVLSPELQSNSSETRWVSICIANNGPMISEERQKQLLEALTQERRTAKETSLSVSYQIVTARHGGQLRWRSPCFKIGDIETGTEFEILLPLI